MTERTDLNITAARPFTLAMTSCARVLSPGDYTLRLEAVRDDRYDDERITNWRILVLNNSREYRTIEWIAEFPEEVSHAFAERLFLDLARIATSGGHTNLIDY